MAEELEDYALNNREHKKGSLKKVGIIGCGTMGQEIAHVISKNGFEVVFVDVSEERIIEVFLELNQSLDDVIEKWGLTVSEKRAILSRIHGTTEYHDHAIYILEFMLTKIDDIPQLFCGPRRQKINRVRHG